MTLDLFSAITEAIAVQRGVLIEKGRLTTRAPTTRGYQKTLEDLLALQAHVAELYAQVASLDEAIRDLRLKQEGQ